MNRPLTALFSALEALLVVGIGIGIPLVPLTLMWAFQYGLQIDWVVFWRAAVDVWLLGHGTDVHFTVDPMIAANTGLTGAGDSFAITVAPLGFAIVTALLGIRAGRRIGETPHRHVGHLVAVGTFGVLSLGVTLAAQDSAASPVFWQAIVLPTLVFALGVAGGSAISRNRAGRLNNWQLDDRHGGDRQGGDRHGGDRQGGDRTPDDRLPHEQRTDGAIRRLVQSIDDRQPNIRSIAGIVIAGGVASSALVIAVSAVAVAVLVAVSYAQIIALYEGVQSGGLGGATLTIAQLALVPNLVIWASAWFVGPGFAVGAGSAISPLGTAVGPIPAIPMLGALPTADWTFAFVGLLVPVLAGFFTGIVVLPRLVRRGFTSAWWLVGTGVGIGIVGGAVLGALAWASGGSAGPGRLAEVGASWWLVGLWAALEIALPATIALFVGGIRSSRR